MPITVICECGKQLRAKDEAAGKRVKCPACERAITLPASTMDDGLDLGIDLAGEAPVQGISPRPTAHTSMIPTRTQAEPPTTYTLPPLEAVSSSATHRKGVPLWLVTTALLTLLCVSGATFVVGTRYGDRNLVPSSVSKHAEASQDIVKAKEFQIVGEDGKPRGKFGMGPDGSTTLLTLNDRAGVVRGGGHHHR